MRLADFPREPITVHGKRYMLAAWLDTHGRKHGKLYHLNGRPVRGAHVRFNSPLARNPDLPVITIKVEKG